MGYYINPRGESKEAFLMREGQEVDQITWSEVPKGKVLVVWVNNGAFTAARIIQSEDVLSVSTLPHDLRPKRFFLIPIEKALPFGGDHLRDELARSGLL